MQTLSGNFLSSDSLAYNHCDSCECCLISFASQTADVAWDFILLTRIFLLDCVKTGSEDLFTTYFGSELRVHHLRAEHFLSGQYTMECWNDCSVLPNHRL